MAVGLEASLLRFPKAVVIRALTFFRSFRVAAAGGVAAAAAAAAAVDDSGAASPTANPSIRSNNPTDRTTRSNNKHPTA